MARASLENLLGPIWDFLGVELPAEGGWVDLGSLESAYSWFGAEYGAVPGAESDTAALAAAERNRKNFGDFEDEDDDDN